MSIIHLPSASFENFKSPNLYYRQTISIRCSFQIQNSKYLPFDLLAAAAAAMENDQNESEILNTYFTNGAEVEVSSDEEGFRGAWYEGTVIRPISKKLRRNDDEDDKKLRVLVEYKTLMADKKGTRRLKETLSLVQLRPRPPRERRRRFNVSEEVDAYHNEGWWEGVVMEVLGGSGGRRYSVFFRGTRDQLDFDESQLRTHREWANGKWTPPLEQGEEDEDEVEEVCSFFISDILISVELWRQLRRRLWIM